MQRRIDSKGRPRLEQLASKKGRRCCIILRHCTQLSLTLEVYHTLSYHTFSAKGLSSFFARPEIFLAAGPFIYCMGVNEALQAVFAGLVLFTDSY